MPSSKDVGSTNQDSVFHLCPDTRESLVHLFTKEHLKSETQGFAAEDLLLNIFTFICAFLSKESFIFKFYDKIFLNN